ncbi:MAG TPA: hypothetical protein VIU41_02370 [Geobacteraceae bacterium]
MRRTPVRLAAIVAAIVGTLALPAFAAEPTAAERVAAIKANLAESQTILRQYEWIETTVVSIKGDEKSRKQQRCYYGADGTIRKVPITQPAPEPHKRGLLGKIEEKKKEDLTGPMQEAVSLVHQYIPLNPNGIQSVTEDGKLYFNVTDPGKQGRLTIRDFLKSGDLVDLDLDLTNNRPLALKINSFLDTEWEAVTLAVTFGSLYGKATFAQEMVLEARGKQLKVTVQNTGYHQAVQ